MDPPTLDASFHEFARQAGVALDSSPPAVGLQTMLSFYQDRRVAGCDPASDGDMLLFQWGTYDWGEGERFELDLTRQVILPDEEDDDAIWQLHLTYRFPTSPRLAGLGSGNRWCSSPKETSEFEEWVKGTPAYSVTSPTCALRRFWCSMSALGEAPMSSS